MTTGFLGELNQTDWVKQTIAELHVSSLPFNSRSNVYENARRIKGTPGLLFGFSAYTTLATPQFVQLFDSQAAPASGQVPEAVFQINGASLATGDHLAVSYIFPGRFFRQGIWVANSTTAPTYTAGLANTFFDCQYA